MKELVQTEKVIGTLSDSFPSNLFYMDWTQEERTRLIDNLFRDYPELIANIKYNSLNNLPTKDWYNELLQTAHNQIKMNNLLNKPSCLW